MRKPRKELRREKQRTRIDNISVPNDIRFAAITALEGTATTTRPCYGLWLARVRGIGHMKMGTSAS